MADTRYVFLPKAAEYPSTNYPELKTIHTTARRWVLAFDAATNESCYWTFIAPQGITGTLTAYVWYAMGSATTGDVDVDIQIEAITDGDATDLDAAESLDTANSTDNTTVPGTSGYPDVVAVTLTNKDSIAAGDLCRLKLTRDAVSDTATGDMFVLAVELRDNV